MAIAHHQVVQPPRYFWRRVIALLIDNIILMLGFTLLIIAIAGIWLQSQPYLPESIFRTTRCEDGASNPNSADMLAKLAPEPGETTLVRICHTSSFMMPTHNWGFVEAEKTLDDGTIKQTRTRDITFSVDNAGNFYMFDAVTAWVVSGIQKLLSIAGFALLLSEWASPGKRAMHLRVVPVEGYDEANYAPPDFRLSLKRESLKNLPLLILITVVAFMGLIAKLKGLQNSEIIEQVRLMSLNSALVTGATFLFAAFIFYWLIQPIIWWTGSTRYDRILGLRVVRVPLAMPLQTTSSPA